MQGAASGRCRVLTPRKLVDLARFERATSTFAESRSDSTELQVHEFAW